MDHDQARRVLRALEGCGVSYAVFGGAALYRMKRDTVRLQDRADAELIRERFGLEDDWPVRKFRSVEEMNRPQWRNSGDPGLYAAIREIIWTFGQRTSRRRFRPGVYRFRSVEDMQQGREQILERDG